MPVLIFKEGGMKESLISRAVTVDALNAVYRFRYRVYVEEMRRPQSDADHSSKTIVDELDGPSATVLAAWNDGEVVGTVRTNPLQEGVGKYLDYYQLEAWTNHQREAASITTRFMIDPRWRLGALAIRMAAAAYRLGLERGLRWDFIDCNAHLASFFVGLGYRAHRPDLIHPEYGQVQVLRLDLNDHDHLASVRSPFAAILREHRQSLPSPSVQESFR